jgi:hypothetical protein
MATFIDQREDEELEDNETISDLDETQEEQPQTDQAEVEDDIPEKYKGKDIKDIVRMHQEAEKAMGRQSSEVGELRRIVDDFVKTQLAKEEQAHASTAQEVDFFEDPQKAVEYAINNHPKIKEAETVSQQLKQSEIVAKLKTEHPDYQEIVQDQSFMEWVTKSKVRTELLRRADQQFDYDSADELLSSWKERQSMLSEAKETEKQSRKDSVKKASTGNVKGSGEAPSRKVYRRADIIKLMQTDPDRYMQLAEEIRNAYAEGRVK